MKKLFALMIALTALAAGAAGKADWDKSWKLNPWPGYKPFPKIEKSSDGLHILPPSSKHGVGLKSNIYLPATAGDQAVFRAKVRGKGEIYFQLQNYAGKNWLGVARGSAKTKLSEDWKEIRLVLTVTNQKKGNTTAVGGSFGVTKGSELWIKDAGITIEKSEFGGDLRFPRAWKVFAPVPADEEAPLDRIPEKLGGAGPHAVALNANTIEFKKYFPERKMRNTAWLYATIYAAQNCEYTIGAGADYFMTYYVNGKPVIDTLKSGNAAEGIHYSEHVAKVKLKAGQNLLAIKFQSGKGANPRISLGGAEDLRNMSSVISVVSEFQRDDYEKDGDRPGNPKRVKGILTDGIEQYSMQAIYGKGAEITFPGRKYTLPSKAGDSLFVSGIRVHKIEGAGELEITGAAGMSLVISRNDGHSDFNMSVKRNGKVIKSAGLPAASFPNDLIFAQSATAFYANALSIQDSKLRSISASAALENAGEFTASVKTSFTSVTVDEYFTGLGKREVKGKTIPFKVDLAPEFDPVKAGWKLAWQDEFNGPEVDWKNNWMNSPWASVPGSMEGKGRHLATIRDGILHIKCEFKKRAEEASKTQETAKKKKSKKSTKKNYEYFGRTVGLYSQKRFGYGYFEARVRFTHKPGWWAAFWLYDEGRNSITGGGYEIDIFEDYSTRGGKKMVANNLHYNAGTNHRSYGYHFQLPGSIDDFYVIGCKWTPFELSFYLNGKLVRSSARHSPYQSMTYDAINHALAQTELCMSVSGQAGISGGSAKEEYSEEYLVDYVRYYEMPKGDLPKAAWKTLPPKSEIKTGEKFVIEVDGQPGPTGAKVTGVYLFDSGSLIDYKTKPPYRFEVVIDQQHYAGTAWSSVGRAGRRAVLDCSPHFFTAAVQDENGKVGQTRPFPVITDRKASKPYKGKIQTIPGTLNPNLYDEGGQNSAYWKCSRKEFFKSGLEDLFRRKGTLNLREGGEWVNWTVEATQGGNYDITLKRSDYRMYWPIRAMLLIDGAYVGDFVAPVRQKEAVLKNIPISAGKHTVLLINTCTYGNWPSSLVFKKR